MEDNSGENMVQKFFTKDEWRSMAPIERTRYSNVFRKHTLMRELGLTSKLPDFIQRYYDRMQQQAKPKQSSMVEMKANVTRTSSRILAQNKLPSKRNLDLEAIYIEAEPTSFKKSTKEISTKTQDGLKSRNVFLYAKKRMLSGNSSEANSGEVKGPALSVASESELDFNRVSLSRIHANDVYSQVTEELKMASSSEGLTKSLKMENSNTKPHQVKRSMKTSFRCFACGASIHSKHGLVLHLKDHMGEKGFECDVCGSKFKKLRSLRKHLSCATAEDNVSHFKCSFCSHTFMQKQSCRNHERIHNRNGEEPCCLCELHFPDVKHLRNHVQEVHLKKMIKCPVCGMSYSCLSHLKRHLKQVSINFPHCCSVCGHKYSSMLGLSRHQYQHGKVKQWKCTYCLGMFSNSSHLRIHLASRGRLKQYECSGCKKKFAKFVSLKRHTEAHRVDRPFKCSECGHTFTSQGRLVSHMKMHTGERWKCMSCGDTFKKSAFLKTHLQIHSRQSSDIVKTEGKRKDRIQSFRQPKSLDFPRPPKSRNSRCLEELRSIENVSPRNWSALWKTQTLEQPSLTPHSQQHYLHQQAGYGAKMTTDDTYIYHDCKKCNCGIFSQSVQESDHSSKDKKSCHYSPESNSDVESDVCVDDTGFDDAQPGDFSMYKFHDEQKLSVQEVSNTQSVCRGGGELLKADSPVSCESYPLVKYKLYHKVEKTVYSAPQHRQGHVTKRIRKPRRVQCPTCGIWISDVSNLRRHKSIHTNDKPYECVICKKRYRRTDYMKNHMIRAHSLQKM